MKILAWILLCFIAVACATSGPDQKKAALEAQLHNKLHGMSASSGDKQQTHTENESIHFSAKSERLSSGGVRTTLSFDQHNKENPSMKDVATAIMAFATSFGFTKIDCPSTEIACFTKERLTLSLESTGSPDSIRIEFVKEKTVRERISDAVLQMFFEGLSQYLQQPHGHTRF